MIKTHGVIILALLISACSPSEDGKAPKTTPTPWDEQLNAMEAFEQTDDLVLDAAERRRQAMDQQLQ